MEALAAAIESSNDTQLKEEFQDLKSKIKLKKGNLREFATKPVELKIEVEKKTIFEKSQNRNKNIEKQSTRLNENEKDKRPEFHF